jgi:probable rRNA maturation factor
MKLYITNYKKFSGFPDKKEISKAVSTTLKSCGKKIGDPYEITILFTGKEEIRELNREYRGIDRATDVISFAFADGEGFKYAPFLLGDIAICVDVVSEHGEKYGTGLKKETIFVIVHGMLHLLGYDHGKAGERKIMREKETEIMDKLFP